MKPFKKEPNNTLFKEDDGRMISKGGEFPRFPTKSFLPDRISGGGTLYDQVALIGSGT
jgi:hypothetical protein